MGKHLAPSGDSKPWTAGSLPNGPTMMGSSPRTHNTHLQSQAPWGCCVVLFSFSHPMAYLYLPHKIAKYLLSVGLSSPWDCRDDQDPTSTPVRCSLGEAQLCHSPPHLEVCAQALCPACLSFLFIWSAPHMPTCPWNFLQFSQVDVNSCGTFCGPLI